MKKFRENMSILFGVIFIMSMVAATGAVEADNYLIGACMAVFGILTGVLTIILQAKED